jgi:hypothetical protein
MVSRERVKRALPRSVLRVLQNLRGQLAPPPLEDIVLHGYETEPDSSARPRLTLVIPSIAPEKAFGGVVTGIDIFLELGKRSGAELRIILDDFGPVPHGHCIPDRARRLDMAEASIQILPRLTEVPRIAVRARDIFFTYNWWTSLNVRDLVAQQSRLFGDSIRPFIYLVQEYEPSFYPFSSTHMMARKALSPTSPCWGIFNSGELYGYFCGQAHRMDRSFVFEPQLNSSLRTFLEKAPKKKQPRLLVYGRPTVIRNCYPAVEKGLRLWAARYPEFAHWQVVSAGMAHDPLIIGPDRVMKSAGKLSLEEYGDLLLTSAAGLSLMSSPHPSYPPLEMAHFGLWTVTNDYANKDMSRSHTNIIAIKDIAPESIADALAQACRNFESNPDSGWRGQSLRPSFMESRPFEFLDELSSELSRIWE